jgi:hypothetical protein
MLIITADLLYFHRRKRFQKSCLQAATSRLIHFKLSYSHTESYIVYWESTELLYLCSYVYVVWTWTKSIKITCKCSLDKPWSWIDSGGSSDIPSLKRVWSLASFVAEHPPSARSVEHHPLAFVGGEEPHSWRWNVTHGSGWAASFSC